MRIEAKELIGAPADRIFAFSQDYSKRLSWDPFLREARMLGGAAAGVGARSWCVSWFGFGMESEYVSFQPPKTVAVKMTRGPWMLDQFAASWNFRAVSAGETEVSFVYSFRVWALVRPFTPFIGAFYRYEMRRRLKALKQACE